jgi:predicted MPP superfamily phosphohydrolase
VVTVAWARRRLFRSSPKVLLENHTQHVDLRRVAASGPRPTLLGRALLAIPGNESLAASVHQKVLLLPRLPPALDGLVVTHLSDWHLTGRVGPAYFAEIVRLANQPQPDLILLTGDLIDSAGCFAWIDETFAQLRARYGVFFILGNHDLRTRDPAGLRRRLVEAGLIDVGGRWHEVATPGGRVVLAGNEQPWFAAAEPDCDPDGANHGDSLRICLAHSPDQLPWARRLNFDLMLAGHLHGGQVCLPGIGPLLAPSLHGVRYASGVFDEPPTVLHVSRGISSEIPWRWNCPPEIARLVLRRGAPG